MYADGPSVAVRSTGTSPRRISSHEGKGKADGRRRTGLENDGTGANDRAFDRLEQMASFSLLEPFDEAGCSCSGGLPVDPWALPETYLGR